MKQKLFCKTHTPIAATHIATRTVTAFFLHSNAGLAQMVRIGISNKELKEFCL